MKHSYITRSRVLGLAILGGLWIAGCSSSNNNPATNNNAATGGSAATGGDTSVAATGGSNSNPATGGSVSNPATGGSVSNPATGGSVSNPATGGSGTAGGNTSTACGTTNGTLNQTSAFATTLDPYKLNSWPTTPTPLAATLELTTTAPTGIDCSGGCAHLSVDFTSGTAAYGGGAIDQYFGATDTATENLLNETVTIKLAVVVTGAATVPVEVDLDGLDTFATTNYVDNLWVHKLGELTALSTMSTVTFKVVDAQVPSWSPTRTVCASGLHTLRIVVANSAAITDANAAKIDIYVQSISITPAA
jgi:hypothetical protein